MPALRRILSLLRGIGFGQLMRWACFAFGALLVVEFLILNCIIIYVYRVISHELSEISSPHNSASFLDKLQNNQRISNLISDAKDNGLLTSMLQETLERLYIVHGDKQSKDLLHDEKGRPVKDLSFIGLDVSHSREATYIYNRIISRSSFPYRFLVVDIGTNDGFLSSNSFNFIQWGWDGVLVEPQAMELRSARRNLKDYLDRYNDGNQNVKFVQAAIGDKDGSVQFVITKATQGAESHVKFEGSYNKDGDAVVIVPSMTVETLAKENKIPPNFGVLSIDAEGMGTQILRQWISKGFRPAYIIFEHLHRQEPVSVTINYLDKVGYDYLTTRGWNLIFEHRTS